MTEVVHSPVVWNLLSFHDFLLVISANNQQCLKLKLHMAYTVHFWKSTLEISACIRLSLMSWSFADNTFLSTQIKFMNIYSDAWPQLASPSKPKRYLPTHLYQWLECLELNSHHFMVLKQINRELLHISMCFICLFYKTINEFVSIAQFGISQ